MAGILLAAGAVGCGGGGGGGDEAAFCDDLDALSEQVADGDLASDDGLQDAADRAEDLLQNASDDQQDAVMAVGEAFQSADPDEAEDTADEVQDQLGDIAEDVCELDDFAVAPEIEETTTTTEPDDTTTTDPDDNTTTTRTGGGGGGGELNVVTGAIVPTLIAIEAGFESAVDLCFRGLMVACDEIFFGAEDASTAAATEDATRAYGGSCGGRIDFNNETTRCDDNIFAATPVDRDSFTDDSFEALALLCQGFDDPTVAGIEQATAGDMDSCDTLFAQSGFGSAEEAYGDTCGGRIDPTVAERAGTCVEIFGIRAEFG